MSGWTRKRFVLWGHEINAGVRWRRVARGFCIRAFYLFLGAGQYGPRWLAGVALGLLLVRFVMVLTDPDETGGLS